MLSKPSNPITEDATKIFGTKPIIITLIDLNIKNNINDITEKTKKWGKNLVLVGNDSDFGYAKKISDENEHVFYYGEMENLENLYKNCDMVCGLYLGRTLIEGFHHNKKGVCYLVDKEGNIESFFVMKRAKAFIIRSIF